MLNQAAALDGSEIVNWPFSIEAFSKVIEWASTGKLPETAELSTICAALMFLNVQPDSGDTKGPVSQCLARAVPPSFTTANSALREDEASFFIELNPHTFFCRSAEVGKPLPLPPGCRALHYERSSVDRANAPLFSTPGALSDALKAYLPREAQILLDAGLVLAGGFLGRLTAWLAGLCDSPPSADAIQATCDLDFFPLGSQEQALQTVRRALLALARDCESTETGMFVVRSQHALTIGMDDCCFDLQIVLCTNATPADILRGFDIDASRFAYTSSSQLIASETAVRAMLAGSHIATPSYQSANFAERLHKYSSQLGLALAIEHEDTIIDLDGKPSDKAGGLQATLDRLEAEWRRSAVSSSSTDTSALDKAPGKSHPKMVVRRIKKDLARFAGARVLREWEEEAKDPWADYEFEEEEEDDDEFEKVLPRFNHNLAYSPPHMGPVQRPAEPEAGPAWSPDPTEPVLLSKKPLTMALKRELEGQRGSGYAGNAKLVVDVWRGQRRRGEQSMGSDEFWRMEYQSLRAYEECDGLTHRRGSGAPTQYPNRDYPGDLPSLENMLNEVVFQQFDAHPIHGNWSACRSFLPNATDDAPLKFLDFIEDAARVLPPECRRKLPRCLVVATPEDPVFNRLSRVGGWYEAVEENE